jgi:hypothetical protein
MIECIFTIDYEIYGNGEGSLRELVYEPAEKLAAIFRKWNVRFVPFVEVAELEMLEAKGADPAIAQVKGQIREFFRDGFELGLHLHPQWYKGRYEKGRWLLDYSEYNLCILPEERIAQIVDRGIAYLREVLGVSDYTPLSFRAGNWLFHPALPMADVLAERGIKIDSSVFKGGLQHLHKLDYRRALRNGYYWNFRDHVEVPNPKGALLELPIYSQMAPTWQMFTAKRVALQRKGSSAGHTTRERLYRLLDFLRLSVPLKLDFCNMTITEFTRMVDAVILEDQKDPTLCRPIVAIGHTKDLVDFETVESLLRYLKKREIRVTTFTLIYNSLN